MPIYEYYCADCRRDFDLLRPMSHADNPVPCPACGSADVERKISTFASFTAGTAHTTSSTGCGSCTRGGGCAGCSSHR